MVPDVAAVPVLGLGAVADAAVFPIVETSAGDSRPDPVAGVEDEVAGAAEDAAIDATAAAFGSAVPDTWHAETTRVVDVTSATPANSFRQFINALFPVSPERRPLENPGRTGSPRRSRSGGNGTSGPLPPGDDRWPGHRGIAAGRTGESRRDAPGNRGGTHRTRRGPAEQVSFDRQARNMRCCGTSAIRCARVS